MDNVTKTEPSFEQQPVNTQQNTVNTGVERPAEAPGYIIFDKSGTAYIGGFLYLIGTLLLLSALYHGLSGLDMLTKGLRYQPLATVLTSGKTPLVALSFIATLVCLILFFKKKKLFPLVYKCTLVYSMIVVVYPLITSIIDAPTLAVDVPKFGGTTVDFGPMLWGVVTCVCLFYAFLIWYTSVADRIKYTFVK